MILETKLIERLKQKLKDVDEGWSQKMSDGMLPDFGEYKYTAGYRRALFDCTNIIAETWDEIQKE